MPRTLTRDTASRYRQVVRVILGLALRGGVLLGAFFALTPGIWSREDLGVIPALAAVSVGLGVSHDRGLAELSLGRWASGVLLFELTYVSGLVVVLASIGTALGEDSLTSTDQRIVASVAVLILAAIVGGGRTWSTRRSRDEGAERDTRREAIRENVRREIEEIERAARQQVPPAS